MALSVEVLGLLAYVKNSGVPHKVTATVGTFLSSTNPCSPHTPTSNHCKNGTAGKGLAIDVATPTPSWDSPGLLAIFNAFRPVEHRLSELIYAKAPYNIKNGVRVSPYAVSSHHDHVHIAVPLGVVLATGGIPPMPDDPNLPNISGPVSFHPIFDAAGTCTGYYIFSQKTGEVHAWPNPATPGKVGYYGRSEVLQ